MNVPELYDALYSMRQVSDELARVEKALAEWSAYINSEDEANRVYLPVANYYGQPFVVCFKGQAYICMEDWDGEPHPATISTTLYKTILEEYKDENSN